MKNWNGKINEDDDNNEDGYYRHIANTRETDCIEMESWHFVTTWYDFVSFISRKYFIYSENGRWRRWHCMQFISFHIVYFSFFSILNFISANEYSIDWTRFAHVATTEYRFHSV